MTRLLGLTTYLMSSTGRTARASLTASVARRGLRLWHVAVLEALVAAGSLSKGELATRLDINPSDIVKVVDDLGSQGYLACTRSATDRRRINVSATPAGRALLAELAEELAAVEADVLAPLTDGERAQLASLLGRLAS
ncbi:DNA-binding MarR family transcriptional regulator [Kitasatospora gansuensis]|uniref:DNA-binding MarR family transcriptional regulator n=1 Tax=Kitasatospora gansuensis TaxID=258050 RepID=A0A7W7S8V8_9ACTN|nr:MarR family winged helix-turn-helix transcriptional regulator [Kitasatospora gansuensis]MBB4945056.1 DNA-binding MarR family transcriptional regulator [Kitasatospora gansuensis]